VIKENRPNLFLFYSPLEMKVMATNAVFLGPSMPLRSNELDLYQQLAFRCLFFLMLLFSELMNSPLAYPRPSVLSPFRVLSILSGLMILQGTAPLVLPACFSLRMWACDPQAVSLCSDDEEHPILVPPLGIFILKRLLYPSMSP